MASNGPNERQEEGRRGVGGGAIASLVGVGLLLIFMIQNTEDVRLDFLVWHFTWPLWLLTIASAALGALIWFGSASSDAIVAARTAATTGATDPSGARPDRRR